MVDLRSLKNYAEDVLGIKSFLVPERLVEIKEPAVGQSLEVHGSLTAKIIFLRKSSSEALFRGKVADLYQKILLSLKRPADDIATIEWTSELNSQVSEKIREINPKVVFALGHGAADFVQSSGLTDLTLVSSIDPADIPENEELKRILWNDIKLAIKHLENA